MGVALGLLRWPPEAFWSATPHELIRAVEAYAKIEGAASGPDITDKARLESLIDEAPHRSSSIRARG